MTPAVTQEQFNERFGSMKPAELADLVKQETGKEIITKGRSKDKVLADAYALYLESVNGTAPTSVPASMPEEPGADPEEPGADPKAAQSESAPASGETLEYEGRSRTGRPFHKLGRVFGVRWEPLGALTDTEVELLRTKHQAHLQIRVRG